jgi:hypothetical protein
MDQNQLENVLRDAEELILLDDVIWLLTATAGVPGYDYSFARFFPFDRAWEVPIGARVVARVGALQDYAGRFEQLQKYGLSLIHTPDQHYRASRLPHWYPLLEDLTPRSCWYDEPPTPEEVEGQFAWPVFVKGERQTDRHTRKLSIASNKSEFAEIARAYSEIPLLKWQRITVREFVPLRPIEDVNPERIPSSFEFRTFWWRGELVGLGSYWFQGKTYNLKEQERTECLATAREAAIRVDVPFLVIDVAQTAEGRWIVIECNDGQESGYAGVNALGMWQRIIDLERTRTKPNSCS